MVRIKKLPGAPWNTNYIFGLLEGEFFGIKREPYDIVIANGFEYTLDEVPQKIDRAAAVLRGEYESA